MNGEACREKVKVQEPAISCEEGGEGGGGGGEEEREKEKLFVGGQRW